ncbi:MAG: DNA-binding protein [Candidatus Thiodiazotropha endolucinida]
MSLQNLVGRSLEEIEPDNAVIKRLLAAATRNIADAKIDKISFENRFDAAYKAIMQLANIALQANGYRTLTSRPGHHTTMIQLLSQTIGLDKSTVIVLDALRKQRNITDYTGDNIPASSVGECIDQAESLLDCVTAWLKNNRPDLFT